MMPLDLTDTTLVAMISRMAEQHMTDPQIATVLDCTPDHVWAFRKHHQIKSGVTFKTMAVNRDDDSPNSTRIETDEMGAKFARLMKGQRFTDVRTKIFGRPVRPGPTVVMVESSLARCG